MLAYVFWHGPGSGEEAAAHEQATVAFHRSLAARPPGGFHGSATYRAGVLPWLAGACAGEPSRSADGPAPALEDWYLVEDWAALGVLRMAAMGAGHVTSHDAAARRTGAATAGVYHLEEGDAPLGDATQAAWVAPARGARTAGIVSLLLGDGMERAHAGLWQRELTLGPAPEYCLLVREAPAGLGTARLPEGWEATVQARELVWEHVR